MFKKRPTVKCTPKVLSNFWGAFHSGALSQ